MIYLDESTIKIGGVILPGLFKSIEIKSDALIEEQTVEGRTEKPKQATGYDDAKINVSFSFMMVLNLRSYRSLKRFKTSLRKAVRQSPLCTKWSMNIRRSEE